MEGTIERKVADKGFGFIKSEDGTSYFFHFTDMEDGIETFESVDEGAPVAFEIGEGRDGKEKAVNVKLA